MDSAFLWQKNIRVIFFLTLKMSCCWSTSEENEVMTTSLLKVDKIKRKIILLGSSGVGKTSLINKITNDDYKESLPTEFLGCSEITIDGLSTVVWDTAGQELHKSMIRNYYRDVDIAIVCFDLSNITSLNSVQGYIDDVKDESPKCTVIVAGLKCDISVSGSIEFNHIKVSSKTGEGVPELKELIKNSF